MRKIQWREINFYWGNWKFPENFQKWENSKKIQENIPNNFFCCDANQEIQRAHWGGQMGPKPGVGGGLFLE